MKLTIALVAAGLALTTSHAMAQEAQCFQNDAYLVIAQERLDEVGADFIIRPPAKGKIACVYEERAGDRLIGDPADPLHYERLVGNYLVLVRSTGPDGDLVIYDLASDATDPVVDVPTDDELTINDATVTYWERTQTGTADNCEQFAEYSGYGFGAVIAEQRVFDIATGAVTATGESRCSSTQ